MGDARARAEESTRLARRQLLWIRMPIAEANLLIRWRVLPRYCEALRCRSKRRAATTFHAVTGVPGESDYGWVACADCTGLMIEGAYATQISLVSQGRDAE
jgi:hypothetical protein